MKNCLVSDFPANITLSGGLDSTILAYHLKHIQGEFNSFSYIESNVTNIDESPFVDSAVEKIPHNNIKVNIDLDEWEKLIDKIVYIQDGPVPSLSMIAQYKLYEKASESNTKLILSGQGADEIFAGYYRNLSLIKRRDFLTHPISTIHFLQDNLKKYLKYKSKSKPYTLFVKSAVKRPDNLDSIQSYMHYLINEVGLRDLLHYEDRNSMYFGIETRLPYLNVDLVESAYQMPDLIKMKGLKRKGVLLDNYQNDLPKKILNRKTKLAFDTPEEFLINKGFLDLEKEILDLYAKLPQIFVCKNIKEEIPKLTENPFLAWRIKFLNAWLKQL